VEVTSYSSSNDGDMVAFYTTNIATLTAAQDPDFGISANNSLALTRSGKILTHSLTSKTTNNQKVYTCSRSWTMMSKSPSTDNAANPGCSATNENNFGTKTINSYGWVFPCTSTSCNNQYSAEATFATSALIPTFLVHDYTARTSAIGFTAPAVPSNLSPTWQLCGSGSGSYYAAQPGRDASATNSATATVGRACVKAPSTTNAYAGDQYVEWETVPVPTNGATICSKQVKASGAGSTTSTFEPLFSGESYDVMKAGKLTKKDCIEIMEDEASGTVFIFRIIGFLLFWLGFYMMFSIVTFLADIFGQLIPCGLGEMLEDCVEAIVCCVTCPPACACWMFWFALAWLIFRPLVGAIVFVISLLIGGGLYYVYYMSDEKEKMPEEDEEAAATPADEPEEPAVQEVAPPPVFVSTEEYQNQDNNGNGVPDQYEMNLPPGYEARMDYNSGQVYWVNHATQTSTWNDPRVPQ